MKDEEMLAKMQEILLKIQEHEIRIEQLEKRRAQKGVIYAGSPKYVKDYMKIKREELDNG